MFYGKIVAGLIGLVTGGVVGLMIGLVIGHFFDRGLNNIASLASPGNLQRIQQRFLQSSFSLLGYLAKADGRVSEEEVAHTESIFAQFNFNAEQRKMAITWFGQGAKKEFNLQAEVTAFMQDCGGVPQLRHTLMMFLLSLALADQELHSAEQEALTRIASLMNIPKAELERLIRMAQAQHQFHGGGSGSSSGVGSLDDAYTALGVEASDSDADIKKAYRKLMSANHPDKLIAQGVPEHMIKLATEKSQEIQGAYELIKKHRAKS